MRSVCVTLDGAIRHESESEFLQRRPPSMETRRPISQRIRAIWEWCNPQGNRGSDNNAGRNREALEFGSSWLLTDEVVKITK